MKVFLYEQGQLASELTNVFPDLCVSSSYDDKSEVLIRWGNADGPDGEITLNTREALQRVKNCDWVQSMLAAHQIPQLTSANKGPKLRVYHALIFDLKVLSMDCLEKGRTTLIPIKDPYLGASSNFGNWLPAERRREMRRAALLARRTVYALGLHFGLVHVVINGAGRALVETIDCAPEMSSEQSKNFAQLCQEYVQRVHGDQNANWQSLKARGLTIGADPEFIMVNNITKQLVMASKFFDREGLFGCDQRSVNGQKKQFPLAEFRPAATNGPRQLCLNLRKVIQAASAKVNFSNIEWRGGSLPLSNYPIGGHIHLGGLNPTTTLIKALDTYLAIPILLLEETNSARTRRKKYGFLGDFRYQPYGGFEYRVLPSWLVSPRITKAVLCLFTLVVLNYRELKTDLLATPAQAEAFFNCDKKTFYEAFPSLWEQIKSVPQFLKYESDLQPILDLVDAKHKWKEKSNFRKNWGLKTSLETFRG